MNNVQDQAKQQTKKNLTAAQRLDALEQALNMTDSTITQMYQTIDRLTKAITLLSKKLEAVKRVAGMTDEAVANVLREIDLEDLKDRIKDMKNKNVLKDAETIDPQKGFVVARELDHKTKEIVEHRIQFPMFSQEKLLKDALAGKKVGDIVDVGEDKYLIEILEVYEVVLPKMPARKEENESKALVADSQKENTETVQSSQEQLTGTSA